MRLFPLGGAALAMLLAFVPPPPSAPAQEASGLSGEAPAPSPAEGPPEAEAASAQEAEAGPQEAGPAIEEAAPAPEPEPEPEPLPKASPPGRWTRAERLSWGAVSLESAAALVGDAGGFPVEVAEPSESVRFVAVEFNGAMVGEALEAVAAVHGLKVSWREDGAALVADGAPAFDPSPLGATLERIEWNGTHWNVAMGQLAEGLGVEVSLAPELEGFAPELTLDVSGERLSDFLRALARAHGLAARRTGPASIELSPLELETSRLDRLASSGKPRLELLRHVAAFGKVGLAFDPHAVAGGATLEIRSATPLQALREIMRGAPHLEVVEIASDVLAVVPRRAAPGEGKPVKTLSLDQVPMARVLELFALKLDFGLAFDRGNEAFAQRVGVDLRGVDSWEAFETILDDHGLQAERFGQRLVCVAPKLREPERAVLSVGGEARVERLVFRDTPLQDAIRLLAEKQGLSVVLNPDDTRGHVVNLKLQNVSARSALNSLLRVYGLEAVPVGSASSRQVIVSRIP